jgi:hypothetical protein
VVVGGVISGGGISSSLFSFCPPPVRDGTGSVLQRSGMPDVFCDFRA